MCWLRPVRSLHLWCVAGVKFCQLGFFVLFGSAWSLLLKCPSLRLGDFYAEAFLASHWSVGTGGLAGSSLLRFLRYFLLCFVVGAGGVAGGGVCIAAVGAAVC